MYRSREASELELIDLAVAPAERELMQARFILEQGPRACTICCGNLELIPIIAYTVIFLDERTCVKVCCCSVEQEKFPACSRRSFPRTSATILK